MLFGGGLQAVPKRVETEALRLCGLLRRVRGGWRERERKREMETKTAETDIERKREKTLRWAL